MALSPSLRRLAGRRLSDVVNVWCRWRLRRQRGASASKGAGSGALVASFYARRNGVAFGAEMQHAALREIGISATRCDASAGIRNPFRRARSSAAPPVAVAHADGRMIGLIFNYLGDAATHAWRVGYCAWELSTPPRDWAAFDRIVHEVWVPSRFNAQAMHAICTAPVRVVPHVVDALPGGRAAMRESLRIDHGDFVVLTMADLRSSLERKNPFAAITAFKAAFAARKDATLIVKVSGADHDALARRRLLEATRDVRCIVIEDALSHTDKWALLDAADAFVSLHRAEGYGLPMAEAMALGKPVVATSWSGNMDYMHAGNALLVDYRLIDIDDPQRVYRSGEWADADVGHAAALLRRLYDEPGLRATIGNAAAMRFERARQLSAFRQSLSEEFVGRAGTGGARDG